MHQKHKGGDHNQNQFDDDHIKIILKIDQISHNDSQNEQEDFHGFISLRWFTKEPKLITNARIDILVRLFKISGGIESKS